MSRRKQSVSRGRVPRPTSKSPKRQRAPRGTGETRIVEAARQFFAERGFRASTRELAETLGVTQALLYRYFPTKQALIDRVFEAMVIDRWDPALTENLMATEPALEARLTEFYQAFARRFSYAGQRLFLRAGLDDQPLAERYTFPLNERILVPVVAVLRREAGLPSLPRKPMLRSERELVMMLHASIVHLGIRKFVYASPLPDNLDEHVAFCVHAFLNGALATLRKIHREPKRGFLAEPLKAERGGPIE